MKPNYNSKRSDFRANENHAKINQPLSQEYQDYAKIFLEEGIAYQTAKSMGDIPPHQLRKILDPIKEAIAMIKKDPNQFNEARNKLYNVVPITAYNTGRNPKIKPLYYFVKNHISDITIQDNDDIYILDKLFTSVIAYHKFLKGK